MSTVISSETAGGASIFLSTTVSHYLCGKKGGHLEHKKMDIPPGTRYPGEVYRKDTLSPRLSLSASECISSLTLTLYIFAEELRRNFRGKLAEFMGTWIQTSSPPERSQRQKRKAFPSLATVGKRPSTPLLNKDTSTVWSGSSAS